jgi:hypothetical protein
MFRIPTLNGFWVWRWHAGQVPASMPTMGMGEWIYEPEGTER